MASGVKCDRADCTNFGTIGTGGDGHAMLAGDWVEVIGPLGVHHACSYAHASELCTQLHQTHNENKQSQEEDAQKRNDQAVNVTG